MVLAGWIAPAAAQPAQQEKSTRKLVTFQTEDGLTIYATLHMPASPRTPMAGAILFAQPGWTLRSTFDGSNVARDLAEQQGMAALTVDFRGNAKNIKDKPFDQFSVRERDGLQLDVRGAITFLGAQPGVDPGRIGLLATGAGADYVVREADRNTAVQALVLVSGTLSDASRQIIQRRHDIPILCLAGGDEKDRLLEMATAYYLSKNHDSRIVLGTSGSGTAMFSRTKGLSEDVAEWLGSNVKGLGLHTAVTFKTPDGWELHGKLRIPDGLAAGAKVPGVVFIHGNNHDHDTWFDLSRAVAKQGMATLIFDWRGKNRDIKEGKGHHGVDMPPGTREKIHMDIQSAIAFLASQPAVDGNRIGLVAATAPTTETLKAASLEPRVKTIVMLSQYQLNDTARKFLTTSDVPIFFVASTEDLNYEVGSLAEFTKEAYKLSKSKGTDLLLYDDAGRGSEMLKRKPELERMIVRWFQDKLTRDTVATSSR
jgi:dienelactone hydrolase